MEVNPFCYNQSKSLLHTKIEWFRISLWSNVDYFQVPREVIHTHSSPLWTTVWLPRPIRESRLTKSWRMWEEPIVPALAFLPYQGMAPITSNGTYWWNPLKLANRFIWWWMGDCVLCPSNLGVNLICCSSWRKAIAFGSRRISCWREASPLPSQGLCSEWCCKPWI